MRVPVTTVPNPATVKERSTGSLGRPRSRRASVESSMESSQPLELVQALAGVRGDDRDGGAFERGPLQRASTSP